LLPFTGGTFEKPEADIEEGVHLKVTSAGRERAMILELEPMEHQVIQETGALIPSP